MTWRDAVVVVGAGEIAEIDMGNLVFGMEFMLDGGEGAED
jgi:hypothetical protein